MFLKYVFFAVILISCCIASNNRICRKSDLRPFQRKSNDGTCNNRRNPIEGSLFDVCIREPCFGTLYEYTPGLPNSRVVSNLLFANNSDPFVAESSGVNMLFTSWGNVPLTLDIIERRRTPDELMEIEIIQPDFFQVPTIGSQRTLYSEQMGFCECDGTYYNQSIPRNTHWIDVDWLYPRNNTRLNNLRTGVGGKLKTLIIDGKEYLATFAVTGNDVVLSEDGVSNQTTFGYVDPQYFVPDLENGLFSTEATYGLSWVYVKEHNFYADQLVSRGYTSDDEIFELTRNHIISSHINILYNEFLPILIGKKTAKRVVKQIKKEGFNRKDIPTISNEIFASVIPVLKQLQAQSIDLIDVNGNRQRLPLPDPNDFSTFFFIQNYTLAISTYKLDRLIRGMLNSPSKEYNEITTDGLRSFASPFFNLDLIAFVIERSRYDGTANYHAIREYIGSPIYGSVEGCPNPYPAYDDCSGSQDDDNDNYKFFYEKTNKVCNPSDINIPRNPDPIECFIAIVRSSESGFCLSDQEALDKASLLKSLYNRIDLIDAFVGMIYEGKGSIGNGGILGNTAHVLAKNYFKRLATSDRLLEFLRDDNDEFEAVSMGQMIENALPQLTVGEKGAFNTFGHSG